MMCTQCAVERPPFMQARAVLKYNDSSRDVILGFKHADKLHIVRAFVPWLLRAGADILSNAELLVPVPLHRWRLLSRRYNQAALIAQALEKHTDVVCIPDALLRTRATPSQGQLRAGERLKNVRKAFAVNPRRRGRIANKRVVLIDDVYTTGATVGECTRALLAGGAAEVRVLTVARVVRDGVL